MMIMSNLYDHMIHIYVMYITVKLHGLYMWEKISIKPANFS